MLDDSRGVTNYVYPSLYGEREQRDVAGPFYIPETVFKVGQGIN